VNNKVATVQVLIFFTSWYQRIWSEVAPMFL